MNYLRVVLGSMCDYKVGTKLMQQTSLFSHYNSPFLLKGLFFSSAYSSVLTAVGVVMYLLRLVRTNLLL